MNNFVAIVNSEKEYLNLIADIVEYGIHSPNPYAHNADEQGQSVVDSFSKFPIEEIYDYFGAYSTETIPGTILEDENYSHCNDDSCTAEERIANALNRQALKLDKKHFEIYVPNTNDYPIIINWRWEDDYDRSGKITIRNLMWWSISKIPQSHVNNESEIMRIHKEWHLKFADKLKEWIRLSELARKRRHAK